MNKIIIIFIVILIIYYFYNYDVEKYDNVDQYDYSNINQNSQNLLESNPYTFIINDYQKEKLFSKTLYGTNDEIGINNDFIFDEPNKINTNVILDDDVSKWHGELTKIPTFEYGDIRDLTTDYNFNKTECGGLGNKCVTSYDCCGGVYCYDNKCQQI